MDTIVLADESYDFTDQPYKSLYVRCVDAIADAYREKGDGWSRKWLSVDSDWLNLVRTKADLSIGGWDTMIPYYGTDCDFYERAQMSGLTIWIGHVGEIYDVGHAFADLAVFYLRGPHKIKIKYQTGETMDDGGEYNTWWLSTPRHARRSKDQPRQRVGLMSPAYVSLRSISEHYMRAKRPITGLSSNGFANRNPWQRTQRGGHGKPFYRDAAGFQRALDLQTDLGWHQIYQQKWGMDVENCRLRQFGLKPRDA